MAVVGPAVGAEAGLGVGLLLTFAAFCGALLLRACWAATFGLIFSEIARAFHKIPKIGARVFGVGAQLDLGGLLAKPFETVDNLVYHALGVLIAQTEHAWHKIIGWMAYILTATGEEIASLSYDTLAALHIVHQKVSPAAIQAATRPFVQHYVATLPAVHVALRPATKVAADHYPALQARVARLEHELSHVHSSTIVLPAPAGTIPRTKAPAATTPVVLPAPRVGEIDRALDWTKGQIGKLRKIATVAGIVGLTAAALGRLGLGWTRCSKVGKVGKQLCGMDEQLLGALLADTLLIVGTVSLVEFAQGMQGVVGEFEKPVRAFWRAA